MSAAARESREIAIRPMRPADREDVVRVHLEAFPGFFLTFLGTHFLGEFYEAALGDPTGVALVASADERLHGFVVGTMEPAGFYGRLLRTRWHRFALASLRAVIRRPAIVPRLARALLLPSQSAHLDRSALLMSLAVDPTSQGHGIGRRLVAEFVEEARAHGCERVLLSTDRDGNDTVNAFYRRLGFELNREYQTPEGRAMNEYLIDLGAPVAFNTRS